jgi:hypothetical protein
MPSIINATLSNGLVTSADNSGSLQLATNNGTTAVTIDTSQNVGIGTASPSSRIDARGSNNSTNYRFGDSTGANALNIYNNTTSGVVDLGTSASAMGFSNAGTERMRIDSSGNLLFNSGYGSVATAYGCRAWVNFDGTSTVTIRGSANVSSITDNGTGDYTVNFTTAMPDANYVAEVSGSRFIDTPNWYVPEIATASNAITTSTCRIQCNVWNAYPASLADIALVCVAIFR